jgi:GNAT superfamily N-acetyltransferase
LAISPPGVLVDAHRLDDFQCTSSDLARWLIHRARKNHRDGASRCFVVCDDQNNVIGYYALAAGAVSHEIAPGAIRRNMPDPVPVAVLGRLAVHANWTGQGIGRGLLKDAIQRTLQAAGQLGIRALLCHAIDVDAKAFYLKHGFVESPIDPMTLVLSLARLQEALGRQAFD